MSFWKGNTASRQSPTPAAEAMAGARFAAPSTLDAAPNHPAATSKPEAAPSPPAASWKPEAAPGLAAAPSKLEAVPGPAATAVAHADTRLPRQESLIGADITIEGKIAGGGSVRIAGKFKGDVNLQGDLTVEAGAKLTGGVRAEKVTVAGELEGNVEEALRVDLLQTGVMIGDLKAGSLTVAAGARMRGQVEFGWDDDKGSRAGKRSNGGERGAGT